MTSHTLSLIESSVKGVAYLKKAAEQGHDMAMQLLETCFRMRKGIVSTNESDIRKFLEMTPAERAVKRAAHELFNSLSNGNAYVTVEQLQNRMREIYKMQQKKRKPHQNRGEISLKQENGEENFELDDMESSSSSSNSPLRVHSIDEDDNHHISEANLLSAAQNYSIGRIPAINQTLTLSIPHPQTLEHVPYFHRAFFHPAMFISLLYHRLIDIFSSITIESMKKYQIFILLAVYAIFSTKNLPESLPAFAYYSSLVIMVIASFKMLKSKHQFIDFRIWSGLFLSYNQNVYADDSENLFLKNNMIPYFWFFPAFAVNLMIHPFLIDQGLPYSEITVIGVLLAFMTMVTFMRTSGKLIDLTILSSFALNVLAKYPYEMDSVVSNKWRFLDLKIPSLSVIGSGIEFSMNFRGLLYLPISIFMLILARRRSWHGIYQFLFPHCVTLAWLQISIINSQSATAFGLLRSTLGVAGIFFFLPIFGLATLLVPVLAAVEFLSVADSTNRIFITISTSLIAIVCSYLMAVSQRTGKYVTYIQVLICILATGFLFRPFIFTNGGGNNNSLYASYLQHKEINSVIDTIEETEVLTFDMYHKYCLASENNRIKSQLRCTHLDNTRIFWNGAVSDVSISSIYNWQRDLLQNYLPDFLGNWLMCYFGEVNKVNCFDGEECEMKDFIDNQKRCNVDKWNM